MLKIYKGTEQVGEVQTVGKACIHPLLLDHLGRQAESSFLSVFDDSIDPFRIVIEIEPTGNEGALKRSAISKAKEALRLVNNQVRKFIDFGVEHEDIWVRYSGNKSFFVEIPNIFGIRNTPVCSDIIQASLEPLIYLPYNTDLTINHPNGMVRAPYSIHEATKRMVVPVDWDTIDSMDYDSIPVRVDEIKLPKYWEWMNYDDRYKKLHSKVRYLPSAWFNNKHDLRAKGVRSASTVRSNCLTKLLQSGARKGSRFHDTFLIASYCVHTGMSYDACVEMIKNFVEPSLGEGDDIQKYIKNAYDAYYVKGYKFSCNHQKVKENGMCTSWDGCPFKMRKTEQPAEAQPTEEDIKNLLLSREQWRQNGKAIPIHNFLHLDYPYWIYPQEATVISGESGIGKSSVLDSIMIELAKNEEHKILKFNTELPPVNQIKRIMQIEYGVDGIGAEQAVASGKPMPKLMLHHGRVRLDEMESIIIDQKPSIVIIDTTENIEIYRQGMMIKEEYDVINILVSSLTQMAKRLNFMVFFVHHLRKTQQSMNLKTGKVVKQERPTESDLKGNKIIQTQAQHIFMVHSSTDEDLRSFYCVKSSDNKKFDTVIKFNSKYMRAEF